MSDEFTELNRRIKELKKWHIRAVTCFNVFETIRKLRAPNILGLDEARSNRDAIGRYRGFFNTAEIACNYELQMTLARIFVAHRDSLYIDRLINYAEGNRKKFAAGNFKGFSGDKAYLNQLAETYEGLSDDDLKSIRAEIKKHRDSINRLKTVRDQQLAHINLKEPENASLTYQELADLIELSEKVINLVSTKHFKTANVFDVLKDQVVNDTIGLVHLARLDNEHPGEVGKLQEKYGQDFTADLSEK